MIPGLPLAFVQPLILLALIGLPVLWWLLRLVPPRPRRIAFPPTRLLFDIAPREETPAFIREAAVRSLAHGETFYTHNFGIPELRGAIARYASSLHAPVSDDRVAVTASGMSALMLAAQAIVGPQDRVVAVLSRCLA